MSKLIKEYQDKKSKTKELENDLNNQNEFNNIFINVSEIFTNFVFILYLFFGFLKPVSDFFSTEGRKYISDFSYSFIDPIGNYTAFENTAFFNEVSFEGLYEALNYNFYLGFIISGVSFFVFLYFSLNVKELKTAPFSFILFAFLLSFFYFVPNFEFVILIGFFQFVMFLISIFSLSLNFSVTLKHLSNIKNIKIKDLFIFIKKNKNIKTMNQKIKQNKEIIKNIENEIINNDEAINYLIDNEIKNEFYKNNALNLIKEYNKKKQKERNANREIKRAQIHINSKSQNIEIINN